jgi:hypothetical protein
MGLMIGSGLLFVYSVLFPLVLPLGKASTEYAALVTSPWWQPLCAFAFIGVLATMIGFLGVYGKISETTGALGLFGFLVVEFAHLLQAAKVTWEFCIYPVLAKHSVSLLNQGVLKSDPLVAGFRTLAMLSIFVGIVTFCLAIIRSKAFPPVAGYLLLLGALLYGIGPLIATAVALTGIGMYAAGGFWLGLHLLRTENTP